MIEAFEKMGRTVDVVDRMEGWLGGAGFVDVKGEGREVPVGGWAAAESVGIGEDSESEIKLLREVGVFHRENVIEAVEAYCLKLFTGVLGWSVEDTRRFVGRVQGDLRRGEGRLYSRFWVFSGGKAG